MWFLGASSGEALKVRHVGGLQNHNKDRTTMNKLAQEIATLINRDPVMASQIKEHISPERLREVLELPATDFDETEADKFICALIENKIPLSRIVAAYNGHGGLHS
jgi:hypothetical protein